ncbi:hypothetical protein Pmani_021089 [Petrolisthes manimaculis]|uniref:Uncharacterized protein n=1 Tax=Petrolisthes manimaculis TaxID=1843537 RepID=A0AAE1U5M6_9EUCA|nr:hypothetical protein Pmani_021089 [Petrolisthes manimaculis]
MNAWSAQETFVASDDDIKSAMKRVYEENKYVVCPHTAVAAAYHYHHRESMGVPRGVLATAAPDKFPEAVAESEIPVRMDRLQHLETMPTKSMWMRKECTSGLWDRRPFCPGRTSTTTTIVLPLLKPMDVKRRYEDEVMQETDLDQEEGQSVVEERHFISARNLIMSVSLQVVVLRGK